MLRRALAALFLIAIVTGVALATPVPVLALTDGVTSRVVWLDDGDRYVYAYVNSVYDAEVEERHLRSNDRLRITSVRSSDIKAVEYFGWTGDIRQVAGGWEEDAPRNEQRRLEIRITPRYRQRLSGPRWTVDLAAVYGDGIVLVTAERVPVITALLRGWRP